MDMFVIVKLTDKGSAWQHPQGKGGLSGNKHACYPIGDTDVAVAIRDHTLTKVETREVLATVEELTLLTKGLPVAPIAVTESDKFQVSLEKALKKELGIEKITVESVVAAFADKDKAEKEKATLNDSIDKHLKELEEKDQIIAGLQSEALKVLEAKAEGSPAPAPAPAAAVVPGPAPVAPKPGAPAP